MTKRTGPPIDHGEEVPIGREGEILIYRALDALAKGRVNPATDAMLDFHLVKGLVVVPDHTAKRAKVFNPHGPEDTLADAREAVLRRQREANRGRKVKRLAPHARDCPRYEPGRGRLERRGSISPDQQLRELQETRK